MSLGFGANKIKIEYFPIFSNLEDKKSRIQEILNLSTCADSSTDIKTERMEEEKKRKKYVSRVGCNVLYVTCHMSHVTCLG